MTNPDDTKIRALAELIHHLRPQWNRGGILAALHTAATGRPLPNLIRAAIDAALDPTAATPGVIPARDGSAWQTSTQSDTPIPPRADEMVQDWRQHGKGTSPERQTEHATTARAAIRQATK